MKTRNTFLYSIPVVCIYLFLALYIFSASLYPGGSPINAHTKGFDWVNNYWCNLTDRVALNGIDNPARPFAITAMILLCFGLGVFFYLFSNYCTKNKCWKHIIKFSGITAMTCTSLVFTYWHNCMIGIASVFGLFALVGVFVVLIQNKKNTLLGVGLLCVLLLVTNNTIYYSGMFLSALPLLQKISTVVFLLWILLINRRVVIDTHNHAS